MADSNNDREMKIVKNYHIYEAAYLACCENVDLTVELERIAAKTDEERYGILAKDSDNPIIACLKLAALRKDVERTRTIKEQIRKNDAIMEEGHAKHLEKYCKE
jgi:hypothetical protein